MSDWSITASLHPRGVTLHLGGRVTDEAADEALALAGQLHVAGELFVVDLDEVTSIDAPAGRTLLRVKWLVEMRDGRFATSGGSRRVVAPLRLVGLVDGTTAASVDQGVTIGIAPRSGAFTATSLPFDAWSPTRPTRVSAADRRTG